MDRSPYYGAPREKLDEIVRQAESLLDAQLTTALAADQRALTFLGLLVAALAALIGAGVALGAGSFSKPLTLITAGIFFAILPAAWSARPTPWKLTGNEPAKWLDDLMVEHSSMDDCKAAMAEYYQAMIATNARAIAWAGYAMTTSLIVTGITMLAGLCWQCWRVFVLA